MEDLGSQIKVTYGNEELEGILITKEPFFTLKLKSGYNLILEKGKIRHTAVVRKPGLHTDLPAPHIQKKGKKISILHTGGTIASRVDYATGAVIAQFKPEDIIGLFPEITEIAQISSRLISNIQSEMMRFPHYNILAEAILEEIEKGADGIIITHGTDTMHYTSAALSFAIDNLPIPVILTGSQRSSDRPSSDAAMNLICAITFCVNTDWKGVGICMHESMDDEACIIIPGLKARKLHTTRRDAFRPVNGKPVARINWETKIVEYIEPKMTASDGKPAIRKFKEVKVGILKARTNMYAAEILFWNDYDGLVIEGFALGHMPTSRIDGHTDENARIMDAIQKVAQKIPVAFASQCIFGRIDMNVYSPGRELLAAGVIGNYTDMTPETAYIKLAWLLSNHKKEEIRELYCRDLKGEISERSLA